MAGSYRPYEPDQVMLLPAAPQDWLPAGHLAHFINDTVGALDLRAFYARYEGGGSRNQPFHPAMMVKVLVYAYATGVFSSRKIERRLHEDLAFRVLAAGNFPRHRTICDFRAFHLKELSELFVQVVRLAREMGLVKLGTVAIDGTKVKANASRHKAMSYERMKQAEVALKAQIDALLARAKATDEAEVNEPELDLPAEIERREARLAAIREARERLEQRQREADLQRGRSDDDDRRPRGPDGQPRGGRYKREFGVPEAGLGDLPDPARFATTAQRVAQRSEVEAIGERRHPGPGVDGQVPRRRRGDARDDRGRADPGRLRLHARIPGRAHDARRQGDPDLRRLQRDPARDHRQDPAGPRLSGAPAVNSSADDPRSVSPEAGTRPACAQM
jgi:transposase